MVLIVEDNKDTLEFMQRILQRQGFATAGAENGSEALQKLREAVGGQLPKLILLDLMMPVMNGWEFMSEKLADAQLAGIPVVVCSAVEPGGLGDVTFLRKPIDSGVLLAKVREFLTSD